MTNTLHARRTDPDTSHDAPREISGNALRASQRAVFQVLQAYGPMADFELVKTYNRLRRECAFPEQSDSGIRTRRGELVEVGAVTLHGKVTMPSGRKAQTWRVLQGAHV